MAFWLFKSEPGTWSWEDQKAAGRDGAEWDGIRITRRATICVR